MKGQAGLSSTVMRTREQVLHTSLSLEGRGSVVQINGHLLCAQNISGTVLKQSTLHWWRNCKGMNWRNSVTFDGGPSAGIETGEVL